MADESYEITGSPDVGDWGRFISENPRGNIFQTPQMAQVYAKTRRMTPISLAALDRDKHIRALLLACVSEEKGGILSPLATRAVITGGPLCEDSPGGLCALSQLMEGYDRLIRKRAVFTEIRPLSEGPEHDALKDMGYVHEDHLNFLLDLRKSPEGLWKGLSKSRRCSVKSAKKSGVTVQEASTPEEVRTFYDLLCETYQRAKVPLADRSLFDSSLEVLGSRNEVKYFLVWHEGNCIGGVMLLIYKGRAYMWYLCGSREASRLYPSDLAVWHAIEWSANNGCVLFDFGGAGKPDKEYGVREFKKQYGGELVNIGRLRRVHSPAKMRFAETGYYAYQKIAFMRK